MAKIASIIDQIQAVLKCQPNNYILPAIEKKLRENLEYHSNGVVTEDLPITIELLEKLTEEIGILASDYVYDDKSESDLKNLILIAIAKCGYEDVKEELNELDQEDNAIEQKMVSEAKTEYYNDLRYNDSRRAKAKEYIEYYGDLLVRNESLIRGDMDGTSRK